MSVIDWKILAAKYPDAREIYRAVEWYGYEIMWGDVEGGRPERLNDALVVEIADNMRQLSSAAVKRLFGHVMPGNQSRGRKRIANATALQWTRRFNQWARIPGLMCRLSGGIDADLIYEQYSADTATARTGRWVDKDTSLPLRLPLVSLCHKIAAGTIVVETIKP